MVRYPNFGAAIVYGRKNRTFERYRVPTSPYHRAERAGLRNMEQLETPDTTGSFEYQEIIASGVAPYLDGIRWKTLLGELGRTMADPQPAAVARIFAAIPRLVGFSGSAGHVSLAGPLPGRNGMLLTVDHWTLPRLLRVWMLIQLPPIDRVSYTALIERLFRYGELEELVALYSALPVFHYPDAWQARCTEGIRSNIGGVREAVMTDNPYPAAYLTESEWNQLILKAFFTDADIDRVVGLHERNNARLAAALIDYAYERHAAGRPIHPMLWQLATPFIDERAYALMQRIVAERPDSAVLRVLVRAFDGSSYPPAKAFLKKNNTLIALLNTADPL